MIAVGDLSPRMDPVTFLLLAVTGLAMGFVNNLAGAGGALGLLAFEFVAHLSPEAANAAMRPAAIAIALAGAIGFVAHGHRIPPRALGYGLATVPGALLGTWCALSLPRWVYDLTLLGVIALLLLGFVRDRRGVPAPASKPLAFALFAAVGLHMGFVQVGAGLLSITALRRVGDRDMVRVNAAKMALIGCSSVASVTTFAFAGAILWGPAIALAAGAGIGSFLGSRFSVRRGHRAVLAFVVAIAIVVLIRAAIRLAAFAV